MTRLFAASFGAALLVGSFFAAPAGAETAAQKHPSASVTPPTSAQPVRVVSANPLTGPVTCQNAVWPNVPPECLKGQDGAAQPVRTVRVVGAQDDLRTNPAAASEAGKQPKKLKRLPAKP